MTRCWIRGFCLSLPLLLSAAAGSALAAPPRPWLCRDKPVVSSDKALAYQVAARRPASWHVGFMRLEPGGIHDGFVTVRAAELGRTRPRAQGRLEPGRYFVAVLQQKAGGRWICARSTGKQARRDRGELLRACFSSAAPCALELTISRGSNY